jgi:hypothetical protein
MKGPSPDKKEATSNALPIIITTAGGIIAAIVTGYFLLQANTRPIQISIAATQTHEAQSTSAAATLAANPTPTGSPAEVPTATLTASPLPQPRIYDFATCPDPCNGSNALTIFPPKTTVIYLTWKYENIPLNASYVRDYAQEKEGGGGWLSWVTYDCAWTKPPSGSYDVSLYDGTGLASGNWRITISVNGVVLLQKTIFFQGHWKNWDPQGVFRSCE